MHQSNHYAFIDSQNLNLAIRSQGWILDFKKFRKYLQDKYSVKKAFLFIGYLPQNQDLYTSLQESGYILVFKPTLTLPSGIVKGEEKRKKRGALPRDETLWIAPYRDSILSIAQEQRGCQAKHSYYLLWLDSEVKELEVWALFRHCNFFLRIRYHQFIKTRGLSHEEKNSFD